MIECLCVLREPGKEDAFYGNGDIIVAGYPSHPWGTKERKEFAIIRLEDGIIEALLDARRDALGEQWPILSFPYAERDVDGIPVRCSEKRAKVELIPDQQALFDKSTDNEIIEQITVEAKAKPAEKLNAGAIERGG